MGKQCLNSDRYIETFHCMRHSSADTITCHQCGGNYSIVELLKRPEDWWVVVDVVRAKSPCCGQWEELRLEEGVVHRGYVYAAASPHFCGMEEYECPELTDLRKGSHLTYKVEGEEQTLNPIR